MKVAVVSDTHGLEGYVQAALDVCRELGVARIIHCGDIGPAGIVDLFSEFPVDYVFGNCDGMRSGSLTQRIESTGGVLHGWCGHLVLEGRNVLFMHGHQEERLEQELDSGQWDLICSGHTHQYKLVLSGKTLQLNPGAFQRRSETPGFAVVEFPSLTVVRVQL
ncbi:MAG: YfcE family phosphodiesterase [Planctomycetia bacterium]|nr:YfcE family phosphodiesterase [Planctomycetia bacterium]